MRSLSLIGIIVLVLGVLSFIVPIPTSKTHKLQAGDASIGITTHHDEKISPVIGGLLCVVGVVLLVTGSRKAAG